MPYHGIELIVIGLCSVIFAFLYTTRLSYLGWGDVLVLIFFGFVPVCGTYYLQAFSLDAGILLLSLISGVAIDALLVINNYRDREQDKISGKRTIIVLGGERFGQRLYMGIGIVVAILIMVLWMLTGCPTILLCISIASTYLLLHHAAWRKMVEINQGKALNKILGLTSRNMFLMAVLLSLAILV